MSEYQYYEFQAVDRVLSPEDMKALRACSSRARITRTTFINHYEWGGFKGDKDRWMERYFDAHLYLSNWGTRVVMLGLPAKLLGPTATRDYCVGFSFTARRKNDRMVLTFACDGEPDEEWTEGPGILPSILPLRTELARGDRRALYLGWLLAVEAGGVKDKELEPPVPPGLQQLSPALDALVEFLRLDRGVLEVAAEGSVPIGEPSDRKHLATRIAELDLAEKESGFLRLLTEDAIEVSTKLRRTVNEQRRATRERHDGPKRRTVRQLRRVAKDRAEERARSAKQRAVAEREQRKRDSVRAREVFLDSLAGKESRLWAKVKTLVDTTRPGNYDTAVVLLVDLRDLCSRRGTGEFSKRLVKLKVSYGRKSSLMRRLTKAGL